MSVSPSLYGPILRIVAELLGAAGRSTPFAPNGLKHKLFAAGGRADVASEDPIPPSCAFDRLEELLRTFTRETTGPAQSHCFAALAMIPALRSSASSSPSRTR